VVLLIVWLWRARSKNRLGRPQGELVLAAGKAGAGD
jgi:hypothetical protein